MAIVNKQQQEIHDAIDPKGAQIRELQKELRVEKDKNEMLRLQREKLRRHETEREWMREHGVMIETTEGMKYLKDEEYDRFFKRIIFKGRSLRVGTLNNDVNPLSGFGGGIDYELMADDGRE